MAMVSIEKVRMRYVKLIPEDEERRRRIVLELQVKSIVRAAFSQSGEAPQPQGVDVPGRGSPLYEHGFANISEKGQEKCR